MYSNSAKKGMTEEKELESIVITIAGRTFPVKLDNDEKDFVHDIEQDINAKIMDFQKTYPNRDKLDCVIMTLLTYTFDLKKQLPVNSQEEIDLKTEKIIQTLSELEID
jgi:cell division protein ZapA (FtsZ GTPase activity inhibitor)